MNWKYVSKTGLLALLLGLVLSGCYKEPNWLDDNVTTGKGNYPVIATLTLANGNSFSIGETAQLDLRYWSLDPIKEIQLYSVIDGTENLESSSPHVANFAEDSQTDKMILDYTVPSVPNDITEITLKVTIVNENTLTRSSTVKINVVP
ncbi:MAG: hypothetical protein EP344_06230 [Bacteroidetes bacterium]|nr:MAG: hypothetical protein EP344_06230 [Bacteroidota bacterium]